MWNVISILLCKLYCVSARHSGLWRFKAFLWPRCFKSFTYRPNIIERCALCLFRAAYERVRWRWDGVFLRSTAVDERWIVIITASNGDIQAAQGEDCVHQATDPWTREGFYGAQLPDPTSQIRDRRCPWPHRETGQNHTHTDCRCT